MEDGRKKIMEYNESDHICKCPVMRSVEISNGETSLVYSRQNTDNEERENDRLISNHTHVTSEPKENKEHLGNNIINVLKTSETDNTNHKPVSKISVTSHNKDDKHADRSKQTVIHIKEHQDSFKEPRCLLRQCLSNIFSLTSLVISMMVLAFVIYNRNLTAIPNEERIGYKSEQAHATEALIQNGHDEIMARFQLDQDVFNSSGKQTIAWILVGEQESRIKTSPTNKSCLQMPERGTYGVFSQFTFSIRKTDTVKKLGHFFLLEGHQSGEQPHQQHITTLPFPENRYLEERFYSNFQSFIAMEAGGKICITVKEPGLLYASGLDNTVNIFKL